jgi:signal transduction histidine kinase
VTSARQAARPPRFPALTVRGWFRVVFAVFAVLAVAAVVIIALLLAAGRQASGDLESGILPAQVQAYRLQGALLDQETGVRGFAITGNRDFLQPFAAGLATEAAAAARLRALIGGNKQLSADLAGLEQAASSWRRSSARPLIALAARGPLAGRGSPGSKSTALLDQSKSSFDRLRTLFGAQNAHLAAAAARDRARVSRIRTADNWAFGIVIAVFLLAAAALTLVLHRAVVRPLSRLRAASRRVVGGDFSHRIEVAGPADLRAVAVDVEAMRSELVTALQDARAGQEVTARQAADLDAQAAELLRSNAELEQFAYVASHDLQEPLRKVASFCQLLEKRYGDQLDDRGRQYIGFAVDGAKRMQVLINDLLTFSRVGRANEATFQLPLGEPLDAAVAALGAAIDESGAVIERPEELPEVMGDAMLLAMLWQNLIGNAIKFRAPGRKPVVRITAVQAQAGDMWEFCVQDNGIGIPAEFADKVFVIFQRLHSRDAYPGSGIGLAICKRIVEYHGGEISLDATYPGGTRICFTLPRIAAAGPDLAAGPEQAADASNEGIPA